MLILAMDLGQSKSVFCLFETRTAQFRFGSFNTRSDQVRKVLRQHSPHQVVVEVCPLAALVYDIAAELGMRTLVADTTQDAWAWRNVKRKTDRDDALKLARLAALGQLNPVHIPTPVVRQWRRLLTGRKAAVAEQTRCKLRIRSLLLAAEQKLPRGKCGWTQLSREALRELARPLAECASEELWRGLLCLELERLELLHKQVQCYNQKLEAWAAEDPRVRLVATIPGVGLVAAATVVAVLDRPGRFRSRRQVASYAGLTPRRYQSGQMDRQGRISKRGNTMLRHMLNQAAWAAVRYGAPYREFYLRVSDGGQKGKRKRAIVAVMHKLLVTAWAILRDQRPYRAPRPAVQATAA
jgi:transposase